MWFFQYSMVAKHKLVEDNEKSSGSSLAAAKFKLSGVKRILYVGLLPQSQENRQNVRSLMTSFKLNHVPCSFSQDMKMILYSTTSSSSEFDEMSLFFYHWEVWWFFKLMGDLCTNLSWLYCMWQWMGLTWVKVGTNRPNVVFTKNKQKQKAPSEARH